MTEAEWLASSNPQAMLVAVQEKASNRKLRLFACASARLRPDYRLNDPSWVKSVRIAEAVADGSPMPDDRPRTMVGTDLGPTSAIAIHAARTLCSYVSSLCKPEAHFLRDIIGNPFRPVTLEPQWITPTVVSLAQASYDRRDETTGQLDQVRLAVLADAVEESSCAEDTLLGHLRLPGPHVRGCWAVDLLLGKD